MALVISLWDEPPQSPMRHKAGLQNHLPRGYSWLGALVLWVLQAVHPALLLLPPKVFFTPLGSQHCQCTCQWELLACLCGQDPVLGLHSSLRVSLSAGGQEWGLAHMTTARPHSIAINPSCTQKQACFKLWL